MPFLATRRVPEAFSLVRRDESLSAAGGHIFARRPKSRVTCDQAFFSEERGKKERVLFPSSPKHKGKKDTYRKLSHERRSREEKKLSFQAGHFKDSVVRT